MSNIFDVKNIFSGAYIPACDAEGYYEHTQCHSSVGMCWCVDKHGVEVPNSRVRGKPNCCKCIIWFKLPQLCFHCIQNLNKHMIYHVAALWYGKEDNQKDKSMDNVLESDMDMDDEDGDSEVEGSADQSLEF